ncbi:MAG: PAS domain-containing protein, partial [Deltaproteobacteria bacterium]|nr:PAS domain-containing protein [Deltaproteobacteria bacterium]
MQDHEKTKDQLIEELREMRSRIALQEINQPRAYWERIFDTIPDIVAILDTQHRIVRANRSMADLSMPHNLAGHHWWEVLQGVYVCIWTGIQRRSDGTDRCHGRTRTGDLP